MCGTETLMAVQLVPQGNKMFRFGIVKTVAGFWAITEIPIMVMGMSKNSFLINSVFFGVNDRCGTFNCPQLGVSQRLKWKKTDR